MAMKVLSVEIGYLYTKVCELDYKAKNTKVYNSFVIPTQNGMLADGIVQVNEEFITSFKKKLSEYKIATKKVIFTVASSKIATREVETVYCKENRIADLVRSNLAEYFPVDVSQYEVAHTVLDVLGAEVDENGKIKKGSTPKGYKLLLLAAPKQVLDSYRLLSKALGLELENLDYNGNSVYQVAKDSCNDGTKMIVKIDEKSSLVLVVKDGKIELNRSINYGVEDAVKTAMNTKSFGNVSEYNDALGLLMDTRCIVISDTESTDEKTVERLKITKSLADLSAGINRVMDYYNSTHSSNLIDELIITGIGSDFYGMDEYLNNNLGVTTTVLDQLYGLNMEHNFVDIAFGEYTACVGAVIKPVKFYSTKLEEGATKSSSKVDPMNVAVIVAVVCVAASLVLVITSLFPYLAAKKDKKNYETTITDLQPVYDTYLSYLSLQQKEKLVNNLDKATVNRNQELVELIENLENKMPKSFCLNDFNATEAGVVINVTVNSKEAAATVLDELSHMKFFLFVDTTSLTEVVTESGEKQYSFAVNMSYAPVEAEDGVTVVESEEAE